jgi:hypothetical protein
MNSGIYNVWSKIIGTHGVHKALLGRLMVHDNELHHLEDHGGMESLFPEGPLSEAHQKNFAKCQNGPYLVIERENDIDLEKSLG